MLRPGWYQGWNQSGRKRPSWWELVEGARPTGADGTNLGVISTLVRLVWSWDMATTGGYEIAKLIAVG